VAAAQDLAPELDALLAEVLAAAGATHAALFALDPSARGLTRVATGGAESVLLPEWVPVGTDTVGACAASSAPVRCDDVQKDPRAAYPLLYRMAGVRAWVALPVTDTGILIGVLGVGHSEPRDFRREPLRRLGKLTPRLAHALGREIESFRGAGLPPGWSPESSVAGTGRRDEAATLSDGRAVRTGPSRDHLATEAVQRLASEVVAEPHLETALAAVLRTVEQLFATASSSIHLAPADASRGRSAISEVVRRPAVVTDFVRWRDATRSAGPRPSGSTPESLLRFVLGTGRAAAISEGETDRLEHGEGADPGHAFAVVPIRQGTEIIGALCAQWSERRTFTYVDLRWLETLASYAAVAVLGARLRSKFDQTLQLQEQVVEAARLDGVLLAARTVADEIGNDLALTKWMAELALRQAAAGGPVETTVLQEIVAGAQRSLDHMRQVLEVVEVQTRRPGTLPPMLDLYRGAGSA
jgi:GAF domain-containing protein